MVLTFPSRLESGMVFSYIDWLHDTLHVSLSMHFAEKRCSGWFGEKIKLFFCYLKRKKEMFLHCDGLFTGTSTF